MENASHLTKGSIKYASSVASSPPMRFSSALDRVDAEQGCVALRDDFAVCGPFMDEKMKDLFIPRSEVEDVIGGTCYTALSGKSNALEVCAPSRKEAHLHMQSVVRDGLITDLHDLVSGRRK